jgi:hypothetical protein
VCCPGVTVDVSQVSVHGSASTVCTTTPSIQSSTFATGPPPSVGVSSTTPLSGSGSSGSSTVGGGAGGVLEVTVTAATAVPARTATTCRPFVSSDVSQSQVNGAPTVARTTPSTR